ncbi:MAG: N-acetylmuramoyl-L-alanine amidase [Prevotella sp.]|jgi:N-acetylmuramoyl-L-alanine amidase|nr:N-acetylmuramoyl-L-alanine amidase [Prevotella sp.]
MKRIASLFIIAFLAIFTIQATDLTGVKIYINPGHGGYDSNDRSIWTVPVPETWTNPAGYWESKSNLVKGLALKELLESAGATVIISRTDNTSGIRDGEQFAGGGDRDLTEIAEEANANNVDHFLSIHSNALGTTDNYLLLLYHGYNNQPTVPASLPMVQSSGAIQINNPLTVWTSPAPILRGDFSFYGDNMGLGVLRPLTVPGFLSEGSFHDYPPETHRLCSNDYCKLEALRFFRHFHNYYNRDMPTTGTIAGFVKSVNEKVNKALNQSKFTYVAGSDDQWLPLNGATVKLLSADGSQTLDTYTTDTWYNGIFAFYNLAAGAYKLEISLPEYDTQTVDVTVAASEIAYAKVFMNNPSIVPEPEIFASELNIYASGLSAGTVDNDNHTVNISYTLNVPATELSIILQKADGEPVEIAITDPASLTKGAHTNVAVNLNAIPTGNYAWRLKATGAPCGNQPSKLSDDAAKFMFYLPRGLAVDNSFESPYFGRIYVAESMGSVIENKENYFGNAERKNTEDGIFIFTPTLDAVNMSAYAGNVSWNTGGTVGTLPYAASSPHRLAIDDAGKVYIADGSETNAGVYVMDPANPDGNFTPVFADNTNHGPILALSVKGSGDNTELYTIDRTYLPTGYSAQASSTTPSGMFFKYAIGSLAAPYAAAPEIIFDNAPVADGLGNMVANTTWASLVAGSFGGFWACQYRAADGSAYPCVFYVNSSGEKVAQSNGLGLSNTLRASMAINKAENLLAVGSSKYIVFLNITYDASGVPVLSESSIPSININGTNIDGIAFDVADNLYAISGSTERFYAYALPKGDNSFITPAPSASILAVNNGLGIDADIYGKAVKSVQYNTLTGVSATSADKGLLLKKTTYTDGSVKVEKVIK